jgi:hypothetical protein
MIDNLHAERDESMIANEEGKNFGSIDQNVEVVDQGFAVEKIVRRNQKIPASFKTFFYMIRKWNHLSTAVFFNLF